MTTQISAEPWSARTLEQRSDVSTQMLRFRLLLLVGDVVALAASVLVAWNLRKTVGLGFPRADPTLSLASSFGPQIVTLWLLVLYLRAAYSRRVFGAGGDEFRAVLSASLAAAGLTGIYCYMTSTELSRGFVLLTFLIGTGALVAWRYVARHLLHRLRVAGRLVHRVVAMGAPSGIAELAVVLERESHLGYRLVGACTSADAEDETELDRIDLPVVGSVTAARQACESVGADTLLVAQGGFATAADLRRVAWQLQGSSIELVVAPSLTDVAGPRIHMRPVAGLPLLHLQEPQVDEAGGLVKRAFDLAGAFTALLLLSPLLLAVTVAIKLEDGGPVLFRQRRIGLNGDAFDCLKFRSMKPDAARWERVLRERAGHDGALWKDRDDPRVTRVGRVIRRFSLDELPQLLNVLQGSMSLVGPRPQQSWEVETYSASTRRRLLVRPGMTGLWQVSGRSDLSFNDAVRLDLYYVDNWSLTSDLVIMAKTVKAVVGGSGAY